MSASKTNTQSESKKNFNVEIYPGEDFNLPKL